MEREVLEKMALQIISSELYYDLADNIQDIPDEELLDLIKCNGSYKKEIKLYQ